MLYVNYRRPHDLYKDNTLEWRVGETAPRVQLEEEVAVVSVYADGDELQHIVLWMHNIPHTKRGVTWRGDFAQFIFDNLT